MPSARTEISPDAGRAGSDLFAGEVVANRVVVKENFEGREALFANVLGNVAPALVTLPTAQFVIHALAYPSGCTNLVIW